MFVSKTILKFWSFGPNSTRVRFFLSCENPIGCHNIQIAQNTAVLAKNV